MYVSLFEEVEDKKNEVEAMYSKSKNYVRLSFDRD